MLARKNSIKREREREREESDHLNLNTGLVNGIETIFRPLKEGDVKHSIHFEVKSSPIIGSSNEDLRKFVNWQISRVEIKEIAENEEEQNRLSQTSIDGAL